ncbi:hypothetical protein [Teredinibacter turnerae]|uniref:hypothetical protein n=1 Tax=Teredinibacter turnerae TaxID=2426 RepID=UPI0003651FEB|nr:hypothetical protein [Teredinibacter turnerae]
MRAIFSRGQTQITLLALLVLVALAGVIAVIFRPVRPAPPISLEFAPAPKRVAPAPPPVTYVRPTPVASAAQRSSVADSAAAPNLPEAPAESVAEQTPQRLAETDSRTQEMQQAEIETYQRANTNFDQQPVDFDWATEYEAGLKAAAERWQALETVSLAGVECRSTMCRVVAYTPSAQDADYFIRELYNALQAYEGGKYKPANSSSLRNLSAGETSVFITREGNTPSYY